QTDERDVGDDNGQRHPRRRDAREEEERRQKNDRRATEDQRDRGREFAEPDLRARHRPREVERQTLLRQLASDQRHAKNRRETAGESDGENETEHGERGEPLGKCAARNDERQQRREREHDRGEEDEGTLRDFTASDGKCFLHDQTSSPATAMKISSSDIGATSATSVDPNRSIARSSKFVTTASVPLPHARTVAVARLPFASATGRAANRTRRNRALSVSSCSSRTRRPDLRMPTRSAIVSTPARSCVVMTTLMPRSASSLMTSSNSDLRATTSRPSVGSSRISSSGDVASASASATCFFCPFDSSPNFIRGAIAKRRILSSNIDALHREYSDAQKRASASTRMSGGASASSGTMPMRSMSAWRCVQTSSPKMRSVPASARCWPRSVRTS